MNNTFALSTALVFGMVVPAALADIDYIERSGKDWIATSRVSAEFTSVAPSVNTPSRIFTASAGGGVEGRDLPGLAVAFRSAAGHYIDLATRKNGGAGNNDLYAVSSEGAVVWLCYSDGWQEVPLVTGDYAAVTEAVTGDFAVALRRDGGIDEIAWSNGWKPRPAGELEQPLVDITTHEGHYYAISTDGDLLEVFASHGDILDGTRKLLEGDYISVAGNTSGPDQLWLADAKGGLFIASGKDGAWRADHAVEGPTIYRNLHADIHHKDGQLWAVGGGGTDPGATTVGKPVDIGSRRELFLDNLLVDRLEGGAQRVFHKPVPREVVMKFDQPWEGNTCGDGVVFRDGDRYRMYYRAQNGENPPRFTCYAESPDGIQWKRPSLGLFEFKGSKDNNIVHQPTGFHDGNLIVFRDENPDATPDALYKAVAPRVGPGNWSSADKDLAIWKSPDGIHWTMVQEKGVLLNDGNFDSQNLVFWDPNIKAYRAYYRTSAQAFDNMNNWQRQIKTATWPDFPNSNPGKLLTYTSTPSAQFYTNVIRPYHRAPHIYLGMPGMYDDRGTSAEPFPPALEFLPDVELRRKQVKEWGRAGFMSDAQLMWSRDGTTFELSPTTFMPPGPERPGSWTYSDNVFWHLVETASDMEGAAPELTLYRTEFYYVGQVQLRRYTLRLDGFASIQTPTSGGELTTPPLIFKGSQLSMNFASSAFGSLRVEIQDADGKPIPGFALADSIELYGDTVARNAIWKNNPDLGALAGKPVRLRFVMRDADLYSIKFE